MRDPRLAHGKPAKLQPPELDWARETARTIALGFPDVAALRKAAEQIHLGRDAFYQMFSLYVIEDYDRRRAWVIAVRQAIREAAANVSELVYDRDHEYLKAETEAWRRTGDPFSVWNIGSGHNPYDQIPLLEFDLLLLLDMQAWTRALDALPAPSLMWEILWMSRLRDDPELILEALSVAPLVVDEQGIWTRSVVPLLMVALIPDYAKRLRDAVARSQFNFIDDAARRASAERDLKLVEEEELPSWLHRSYDRLLARSDGKFIAYALLAHLAPRGLLVHEAGPTRCWSADRSAFEALSIALAGVRASVEEARNALHARRGRSKEQTPTSRRNGPSGKGRIDEWIGEGNRTLDADCFSSLLGISAVLAHVNGSEAEVVRLWPWFEELLVGRDPGLHIVTNDALLREISKRLGAVFAKLPDPVAAWRSAYRALEPQRRRGMFGVRYFGDSHFDNESMLLIYVGLHGCDTWIEGLATGESRAPAQDLFWTIYESARRLWLTAAFDLGDRRHDLVAACFAFMPTLFGETFDKALERALPPIGDDAWLLATACSYIQLNGVNPKRLEHLVAAAGFDLAAALQDAYEWSTLTGQKDEFPQHFRTLADAISANLGSRKLPNGSTT